MGKRCPNIVRYVESRVVGVVERRMKAGWGGATLLLEDSRYFIGSSSMGWAVFSICMKSLSEKRKTHNNHR